MIIFAVVCIFFCEETWYRVRVRRLLPSACLHLSRNFEARRQASHQPLAWRWWLGSLGCLPAFPVRFAMSVRACHYMYEGASCPCQSLFIPEPFPGYFRLWLRVTWRVRSAWVLQPGELVARS